MNLWLKTQSLIDVPRVEAPGLAAPPLLLPAVVLFTWLAALSLFHPLAVTDEAVHVETVQRFAAGDWDASKLMMVPGYHALLSLPGRVIGVEEGWMRLVSAVCSVLVLALFVSGTRGSPADDTYPAATGVSPPSVWLVALLPVFFPFTALAYTEAVSLLFLLTGVVLHLRHRFAAAAVLLLLACAVRQSNMIWVMFLALWSGVECLARASAGDDAFRGRTRFSGWLGRCRGYGALLALGVVFVLARGGATWAPSEVHNSGLNPAQLFSAVGWFGLLAAPLLLDTVRRRLRVMTVRGLVIHAGVGLALTALLVLVFRNPHAFNGDPFYLRNRPLLLMEHSLGWRILGSAATVAVGWLAFWTIRRQPHSRVLALWAAFSVVYVMAHPPVDPRYYIVPLVLFLLFTRVTPAQNRKLIAWYAAITVVVSLGIVSGYWML